MSANMIDNKEVSTATDVVDDAVGVSKRQWYVAIVNHNTEKQAAEKLSKLGIINYLPTQSEIRVWKNGRKSKVDRVVIPSTVFVYCTEQERREIVGLPFVNRFMMNKAGFNTFKGHRPLAIITEKEINLLKYMLGQSDVAIDVTDKKYKRGERVKIIRGCLVGLEGQILEVRDAKSELIVELDFFGCARFMIDSINLAKL